jgi:serine/threonine protein kinase
MSALSKDWRDSPKLWKEFPMNILPKCTVKGQLYDASGVLLCKFSPLKKLGGGTFGHVDAFTRLCAIGGESMGIAIKRPKFPQMKLLNEALFQWKLHHDLEEFGLSFCVPKVYDIFRYQQTGDIWFSMEAYEPQLVSHWCVKHIKDSRMFILLFLQISLILEFFEEELKIDHRDLKINNMLIVEEPVKIDINWNNSNKTLEFPFRIVFLDFGFACIDSYIDVKGNMPGLDACPKEGRDIFQILVSLWNTSSLRNMMDHSWTKWIRRRISTIIPSNFPSLRLAESTKDLGWMYTLTDDKHFRAPLCAPKRIIYDCMIILEGKGIS